MSKKKSYNVSLKNSVKYYSTNNILDILKNSSSWIWAKCVQNMPKTKQYASFFWLFVCRNECFREMYEKIYLVIDFLKIFILSFGVVINQILNLRANRNFVNIFKILKNLGISLKLQDISKISYYCSTSIFVKYHELGHFCNLHE